jgi:hypothetical protein
MEGVDLVKRMLNTSEWAMQQFGSCELGDLRRTKRAVRVATQIAEYPDGSTPDQTERWADLKAAYRLFDAEDVTFTALARPHWRLTRSHASGTVLLIGDTTETDFGIHRNVDGLGPTGDGRGRGFLLHNSLMVNPDTEEIIGLAGQELFYRKPAPKNENSYQRTQRSRESEVWGRVIDLVGPPREGVRYIHVFDRGADNLEVFCRLLGQNCGWVIRAAQLHRNVQDGPGQTTSLRERLASQPVLGTYELKIRAHKKRECRTATLEVRCAPVTLLRPKRRTPYLKQVDFQELSQWVVEAREVNPPRGVKPLHWVLYTSEPVASFEDAWRILEYYEQRWLIEEFHKALKTGCRLESRQYAQAARLEAVAGMLSVVGIRLLQMKRVAQQNPDRPAEQVVPRKWLQMLRALRKHAITTAREFFRQLAGLGGHLGRRHDGEPGWITIWRGMKKLHLCLRGHEAMKRNCG